MNGPVHEINTVKHLFSNFLEDVSEYERAKDYWLQLWRQIDERHGRRRGWRQPWFSSGTMADGEELHDGNPIFSAYSPVTGRGIRVIQHPPASSELEFDYWLDTFGGKLGEPGVIRELVISLRLSDEAARRALELLAEWCSTGKVPYSLHVPSVAVSNVPDDGSRCR